MKQLDPRSCPSRCYDPDGNRHPAAVTVVAQVLFRRRRTVGDHAGRRPVGSAHRAAVRRHQYFWSRLRRRRRSLYGAASWGRIWDRSRCPRRRDQERIDALGRDPATRSRFQSTSSRRPAAVSIPKSSPPPRATSPRRPYTGLPRLRSRPGRPSHHSSPRGSSRARRRRAATNLAIDAQGAVKVESSDQRARDARHVGVKLH